MGRRVWVAIIVMAIVVALALHRSPRSALSPARPSIPAHPLVVERLPAAPAPLLRAERRPNLTQEPWALEFLADSDPEAVRSFDEGMALLNSGHCVEARTLFDRLGQTYPADKVRVLASWAIGLAYLAEGGTPNWHQAANQFIRFRDTYQADQDVQELVRAAMIDIPIVSMDLMHFAPSEYERMHAAALAQQTLKTFLDRWPDDPQAAAIRAALAEVESYLANPR